MKLVFYVKNNPANQKPLRNTERPLKMIQNIYFSFKSKSI